MPLTPSPINRAPTGLLDYLGIRAGGRQPQSLSEQLFPFIDLGEFYKRAQQFEVAWTLASFVTDAARAALAIPSTSPVQLAPSGSVIVPSNELWILRASLTGMRWTLTNGGSVSMAKFAYGAQGPNASWFTVLPCTTGVGFDSIPAATPVNLAGGCSLLNDVWLPPGTAVSVHCFGVELTAPSEVQLAGALSVVRLRA